MNLPRSHPNPQLSLPLNWPDATPGPNLWYRLMRRVFQVFMGGLWKLRIYNRHYEPTTGGAVYVCNHQSFLDPMLMSLALRRPMNFMARDSLFKGRVFRPLIESLNAFPVRRGKADTAALKESMRRLKAGQQLVVFAEGTRTRDARIGPLLPGVALLSQRAAEWTVPVVIDGAFEAWPRNRALPSAGLVTVQYGRPIPRSEARQKSAEELMTGIRQTLIDIQSDLRRRVGRPTLEYPDA